MKNAVVMQTDFGTDNLSVCTMRGVCRIVDPELDVYDATHAVPQFDVLTASDDLMYTMPFWPKGTVFVSVVDPGVGTKRRASVAKLKNGQYVVTPDNGSLTYPKLQIGIEEIREIDETINRYPTTRDVHIFHGRDLFAYCAARLAAGVITFEEVGPAYPVEEVVEAEFIKPEVIENGVTGMITEATHHFGLTGTNIPFRWLMENGMNYGDVVHVAIEHDGQTVVDMDMPLEITFGCVPVGHELVLSSETSQVMIAVNQGNMVERYNLGQGPKWRMTVTKK